MADLYKVTTKFGYQYKTSDPERWAPSKKLLTLPTWNPDPIEEQPAKLMRFLGQAYGREGAAWNPKFLSKFGVESMARLPEYMFHMPDENIRQFLKQLLEHNGFVYIHRSSTAPSVSIEVWFQFKYAPLLPYDLRVLLWQLGIRSRVGAHQHRKTMRVLKTSGRDSYLKMHSIIMETKSALAHKGASAANATLPLEKVLSQGPPEFKDRIYSIEKIEEQGEFIEGLLPILTPYHEIEVVR